MIKTRFKALALTAFMAALLPMSLNAQSDGFFRGGENESYQNRDVISGGITNNDFNDTTPLGSGLLIMVAAGAGYAVARRKRSFRKGTTLLLAFVMLLGMTQCKKNNVAKNVTSEGVQITLNVDDGSKYEVNPPHVTFESGDKMIVAYNGYFLGTLTCTIINNVKTFVGTVWPVHVPATPEKLHFYFLGNYHNAMLDPEYDYETNIPDLLSDQTAAPKILSYGVSKEDYGSSSYTAKLDNKCTLVKFTLPGEGTNSAVTLLNMPTHVDVSFRNNTITAGAGSGSITLYSKSATEKFAVLFPSLEEKNTIITIDGQNYAITIPALTMNDYINIDVDMSTPIVTTPYFSVGENTKVVFSKGNLQYTDDGANWQTPANQYVYLGTWNGYDDWNDIFGWSTWGDQKDHVSESSDNSNPNYIWTNDFVGTLDGHDDWFTLSADEWDYLLNSRTNATAKRGIATLTSPNVKGLVILRDDQTDVLKSSYNAEEWAALEAGGAVFLPMAGTRYYDYGWQYDGKNGVGVYWTSTASTIAGRAKCVAFADYDGIAIVDNDYFANFDITRRSNHQSVRLVRPYTAK